WERASRSDTRARRSWAETGTPTEPTSSTISAEATSPASWPPTPSATSHSPACGTVSAASSLWSRTQPWWLAAPVSNWKPCIMRPPLPARPGRSPPTVPQRAGGLQAPRWSAGAPSLGLPRRFGLGFVRGFGQLPDRRIHRLARPAGALRQRPFRAQDQPTVGLLLGPQPETRLQPQGGGRGFAG